MNQKIVNQVGNLYKEFPKHLKVSAKANNRIKKALIQLLNGHPVYIRKDDKIVEGFIYDQQEDCLLRWKAEEVDTLLGKIVLIGPYNSEAKDVVRVDWATLMWAVLIETLETR